MYVEFDPDDELNQGDIINDVVVNYLHDISNPTFLLGERVVQRDLAQPFPNEDLLVLGEAVKSRAMIVTQGCDIDHGDFLCVARIMPFSDNQYAQAGANRKPKYILDHYQKIGVRPGLYYLQASPASQFPASVVSLLELHTINKNAENLAHLKRNRILRLMNEAVEDFQFRLAFFFGRFAAITDRYMLTDEEKLIEEARLARPRQGGE